MKRGMAETLIGFFVLIVTIIFLIFALQFIDKGNDNVINLKARFYKVGNLNIGNEVKISGVKVGVVTDRSLDKQSYEALITFSVDADIRIPADTSVFISSEGLLGGAYLRLSPGISDQKLREGDEILKTWDYESLEDSVSKIIFMTTDK
jgi:phospholipid/cholesterol/gamma-HCH transport system substrate-binding protein